MHICLFRWYGCIPAYYKETIIDQAKNRWAPTQSSTWLQFETAALTSQPRLILSAFLLQQHGVHSYLQTINATFRTWKATLHCTKGIPHCLLSFIPLTIMQRLTPDINLSNWITSSLTTVGDLYKNCLLLSFQQLWTNRSITCK